MIPSSLREAPRKPWLLCLQENESIPPKPPGKASAAGTHTGHQVATYAGPALSTFRPRAELERSWAFSEGETETCRSTGKRSVREDPLRGSPRFAKETYDSLSGPRQVGEDLKDERTWPWQIVVARAYTVSRHRSYYVALACQELTM